MTIKMSHIMDRMIPIIFFLTVFCLFGSKTINDPDFWWHLKSGEYIVEHKEIPVKDPFSLLRFPDQKPGYEAFILKAYWLSQALFYLIYKYTGFAGIYVMKSFVYTLLFFIQWLWMKKFDVRSPLIYFLSAFSVYIMLFHFPGERPQLFTFLFTVTTVYLLEDFKRTGKGRGIYLLPVISLLWSNIHAGYVIGMVIIIVFLATEGIQILRGRGSLPKKESLKLFVIAGISFMVFLVSPNTYEAVHAIFSSIVMPNTGDILEYKSLPELYIEFRRLEPLLFFTTIVILAVAAAVISLGRLDLFYVILFCGLIYGGFHTFRLFAFTAVLGIPVVGIYLNRGIYLFDKTLLLRKVKDIISYAGKIIIVCICLIYIAVLLQERLLFQDDYDRTLYPAKAADFILKNKMQGNIFHQYNWGGYLLWRLYPQFRVFLDGRTLSQEAYETHLTILAGDAEQGSGKPKWRELLDTFQMNIVLLSPVDIVSGDIYPLVAALKDSEDWRLVYFDDMAIIFVREGKLNLDLMRIYSMPKKLLYNTVIDIAERGIIRSSQNPKFYALMALGLRELGKFEESQIYLDEVKLMTPKIKGEQSPSPH